MHERTIFIKDTIFCASEILLENFGKNHEVSKKGAVDFVTEVDKKSEDFIIENIKKKFPDDGFFSEEHGTSPSSSGYSWIIDPLDGTTNYLHGHPIFAISVALSYLNEVIYGAVFLPYFKEFFEAYRGEGAYLNNRRITTSRVSKIENALFLSGFPYYRREIIEKLLKGVKLALMTGHGFRRCGAASVDLCFIACGRGDVYFEEGLKPYDVEAGKLIVTEAGGKVSDYSGKKHSFTSKTILATNGKLHDQAISSITSYLL